MSVRNRIELRCAQCDEILKLKPSVIKLNKTGRFYCDRACMGLWRSANLVGPAHHNFKEKISVACVICGKGKTRHASLVEGRSFFLCSKTCRGEWNKLRFTGKKIRVTVACAACGKAKDITPSHSKMYAKFFCNLGCRSNWNAANLRGDRNPNWGGGGRTDPLMRSLNSRMANGMRASLATGKGGRSWEELIGYTVEELFAHLDPTMPVGSTWDDFLYRESSDPKKVDIDHIRPISSFTFSTPEDPDFQQCWELRNLQLLTHPDNMRKSKNRLATSSSLS